MLLLLRKLALPVVDQLLNPVGSTDVLSTELHPIESKVKADSEIGSILT
jgi:hypothetical protein